MFPNVVSNRLREHTSPFLLAKGPHIPYYSISIPVNIVARQKVKRSFQRTVENLLIQHDREKD